MKTYNQFIEASTGKYVNVEYKIVIRDSKDNPELLVTDFTIVNSEDKKLKIKAKGYENVYLNGYNDGKKKKGWSSFDDFKDDKTRTVWNKNFEIGSKKIKVITNENK
jgi:hypothetical protein